MPDQYHSATACPTNLFDESRLFLNYFLIQFVFVPWDTNTLADGVLCTKGLGVSQDYGLAMRWFQAAAAQNQPESLYNIGVFYEQGLGVTADRLEAASWYLKAANLGYEPARVSLERLYAGD